MQEGIFNEIEYQEFGDTRNPKGFSEDNYNKHNKGKKEMLDTASAVFSKGEELEKMGLRVPQITKLMMLLRGQGIPVSTDILTVEQGFSEIVSQLSV